MRSTPEHSREPEQLGSYASTYDANSTPSNPGGRKPTRHTRRPLPSAADRLRRLPTDGHSAARRDRLPVPLRYKGSPDFNRPATFRPNLVHAREGVQPRSERPALPRRAARIRGGPSCDSKNESPTIEAISYDKGRSSSQLPGFEQDTPLAGGISPALEPRRAEPLAQIRQFRPRVRWPPSAPTRWTPAPLTES